MSYFNSFANSDFQFQKGQKSLVPVSKFDMNQNQARNFGPLLAVLLVNLLAKAVTAKYYPYLPYHLNYEPVSWLPYNKPQLANLNHHSYYSDWHPIKNPYHYQSQQYQTYPVLTTASPYLQDYGDIRQEYDYYDKLVPAESNHISKQSDGEFKGIISLPIRKPEPEKIKPVVTTTEAASTSTTEASSTSTTEASTVPTTTQVIETTPELVPAESSFYVRRQTTRKRGSNRRGYPQKRRRTTTSIPAYYDSYEDYTEKPLKKRKRPQYQSEENYYDDEEYYDSFEVTTKASKKQKRRPTRRGPNKNQNRNGESGEIETGTAFPLNFNPNTEIVIVRQAQSTTPGSTTTTGGSTTGQTTTTEPTTIITNTTISSTPPSNETYGYGPSNGNEYVSFTYGPPTSEQRYPVPYFDWYSHEATKNAIVKRVHDIVGFDQRFN